MQRKGSMRYTDRSRRATLCVAGAAVSCLWLGTACEGQQAKTGDDFKPVCPDGAIRSGADCLVACPEGWGRGVDDRCRPPCLDAEDMVDGECRSACPAGTVEQEKGGGCLPQDIPDYSECPVDLYNEAGASGERVYVNQAVDEASVSDGTRAHPFRTLGEAVEALNTATAPDSSVLIAAGEYNIDGLQIVSTGGTGKISIIGRCPRKTRLITAPAHLGFYLRAEDTAVTFEGLDFQGGRTQIDVSKAASVSIDTCTFNDWTGDDAVNISVTDRFDIRRTSFSLSDEPRETRALYISADAVTIESNHFSVVSDGGNSVLVANPRTITVADNRVEGRGSYGISILLDKRAESVWIRRNAFDGNWSDEALSILGQANTPAVVTMESNFLENHRASEEKRSVGLKLNHLAQVSIADLRIVTGNMNALHVYDPSLLDIVDSSFKNVDGFGVFVKSGINSFDSCSISIWKSRFTGIKEHAIYHEDPFCDLELRDNVIEDTQKGIYAAPRTFNAEANAIGAVGDTAIYIHGADAVSLKKNTIASGADAGIRLSGLQGGGGAQYTVEGNGIFDCQGVGLAINGTGAGEVVLSDNEIQGVRKKRYEYQGATGAMGDGVLISSYSREAPTRVRMVGNTIGRNARLGVLADGPGSRVEASGTRFEEGNGYGGLVEEKQGMPCDMLSQADASVSGTDAKQLVEVSDLFVAEESR